MSIKLVGNQHNWYRRILKKFKNRQSLSNKELRYYREIGMEIEMTKTFDSKLADEAQREYCKEKGYPKFAMGSICLSCRKDIYSEGGISVKQAGESHITGCPFCRASYCD